MKFLAHRGLWRDKKEQNTLPSFRAAISKGFGIETDVRDFAGSLRIAHEMPSGQEPHLEELTDLLQGALNAKDLPLALNIKADGLALAVSKKIPEDILQGSFFFDMSIPDQRTYHNLNLPVFTRLSEVEKNPAWFESAQGVWLDHFDSLWFTREHIDSVLKQNKKVCVVSSELHGRSALALWDLLSSYANESAIMLCTDYPEEAKAHICKH
jgi:glycerophosphoryl diester phosphodiesterase